MHNENKKLIYAYIFDSLGVFDELDLVCHFATDEEYKNLKNDDYTWYPIFNRVLRDKLNEKGYPFSLDEENEFISDN